MHEHKDCKHDLKYCKVCDTVYCEICSKEWKTHIKYATWYNTQMLGGGTLTVPDISHKHNNS